MGSPESAAGHRGNEYQHRVRITKPFYLGVHEVTQGQWESVMDTRPWSGEDHVMEGTDYPATHVDWEDAREFCRELSAMEGVSYRLPTEAEWEKASRWTGTEPNVFPWGDTWDPEKCNNLWDTNSAAGGTMARYRWCRVLIDRIEAWVNSLRAKNSGDRPISLSLKCSS